MEIIKGIATLVPLVVDPLKVASKHVMYPFKVSSNISSLELATRELRALKSDVETAITKSQRENGMPTEEINVWLAEVETFEHKAAKTHQQQCRCLWNISPNPWSNYKISRSAAEKQLEVKSLCNRRAAIKEVIMPMPPPLAQEMPVSSSKSPNLELALSDIKCDSHSIIGIWGMGGVGKTHLLKQINNELSRDGGFNVVVFVTCSKECSAEKVQKEIIKKLGLIESDSAEIRQITIHNFLKQKRFVLLLDDLWSTVDLQTVGIPTVNEVANNCKSKVVLTTRSKNVCARMMVDKLMKVNVLDWSAAWILFKGQANEKIIESNPLVRKYAAEIIEELGRLPLALITIGRALSHTTDPREWKHVVALLKQARLHEVECSDTDETVFKQLKFSYDKLRNDNLRECFLHCSLWPEDYEIKNSSLIELWMGLGLIDEDDIHVAYNVGYSYIRELQAVCLLEATYMEYSVKLHDTIRDMSLWIVRKQEFERNKWIVTSDVAANFSKDIVIQENTTKISGINLRGGVSFSNCNCDAKINTLLLMNCRGSPYFSWHALKELKHQSFSKLTVISLRNNGLNSVPIVICDIITLRYIDLSENPIDSLQTELGALENLKYLLLRGNRIRTIEVGTISKMRALSVLDLTPGKEAGSTSMGEIEFVKLLKLETKEFVSGSAPPNNVEEMALGPALINELETLPKFVALGIKIEVEPHLHKSSPHFMEQQTAKPGALWNVPIRWLTISTKITSPLFFFDYILETSQSKRNVVYLGMKSMLSESLIFECTCENPSCELDALEELDISDIRTEEILWKGLEPKTLLPMLKCLKFSECKRLTSVSWVVHLPSLQELDISQCPGIKQVVSESTTKEIPLQINSGV